MTKKSKLPKLPVRRKKMSREDLPIPRITNESVAEHREEVLGKARKHVRGRRRSRRSIVKISISIAVGSLVVFLLYCILALYRFQSTSSFIYGVTRVIPFPVAYADGRFVSYESYLFELRHFMYYYQNQQNVNFKTQSGMRQLDDLKQRSLDQAVNRAYVAKLANQHDIQVLPSELNRQIEIARNQSRLGASDAVFQSVLKDFWGWSVADFRRELRLELLDQKVAATLDTETTKRAKQVHLQLEQGGDFAKLATQYSDDIQTKDKGGKYSFAVNRANRDISPLLIEAIYKLPVGKFSEVIDTGYKLEIVKVLKIDGDKRQVAHIAFSYKDINDFVRPERKAHKPTLYINVK